MQEDIAYSVNGLPEELTPVWQDEEGNQIVDPAAPVEFFRTAGDLRVYGGIYRAPGSNIHAYQMKVFFQNVEDQIDISGAFQYGATVHGDWSRGRNTN